MFELDNGECKSNVPSLEFFLLSKFQDTSILYRVGEGGELPILALLTKFLEKERKPCIYKVQKVQGMLKQM
jgi:hypothetical protein